MKTRRICSLGRCFFVCSLLIAGIGGEYILAQQTASSRSLLQGEKCAFLIITPRELKEDFQPLQQHKEEKGIATKIVDLTEIDEGSYFPVEGRDAAERIKYFIKHAKEEWSIRYVMLVGGKEEMPVRYSHCYNLGSVLEGKDWPSFLFPGYSPCMSAENTFISDLYYADLYDADGRFCSWDSNNNSLFGEVGETDVIDEVDLYPDVFMGRLLCSDSDDVQRMVTKIIDYENNVSGQDWLDTVLLCGGDTHPGLSEELLYMMMLLSLNQPCRIAWEGEYLCEQVAALLKEYHVEKCYASGLLRPSCQRLTVNTINSALNEGCRFFLYCGHGFGNCFATHPPFCPRIWVPFPSMYTTGDISSLKNKEKLSIAVFNACHCGNFDDVSDPIAWAFVNYPEGGTIGSLACTTVSFCSLTSFTSETYAGHLTKGFFEHYVEGTDVLGDLWGECIEGYLEDDQAWLTLYPSLFWLHYLTLEEWVLFGDPTLKIGGYA
jgi:hypothetical protein